MTEWEPATEAEVAMRDALRGGDQERYFHILARAELLLPISADALAGRAPVGWGTWTTGARTHVLAFTSTEAMRACLAEHAGTARRVPYPELASHWPNLDWWLAVDPGLPIEGYLPAWFVSQLARGDVRLPGRTLGARARIERVDSLQRARAVASVPARAFPSQPSPEPAAVQSSVPPSQAVVQSSVPFSPDVARSSPAVLPSGQDVTAPAAFRASVPVSPAPSTVDGVLVDPLTDPFAPVPARSGSAPVASRISLAGSLRPRRRATDQPGSFSDRFGVDPADGGLAADLPVAAAPPADPPPVDPPPAEVVSVPVFDPANDVEVSLLSAVDDGNTDSFLSTLLLARVLLPVPAGGSADERPGDPSFVWRTETMEDQPYVVVFTSPERLVEHLGEPRATVGVKFAQLIRHWPDEQWSFAVNPGTPVGAKLPGTQIVALANWAAEVGLGEERPEDTPGGDEPADRYPAPAPVSGAAVAPGAGPTVMQKPVPPSQVDYYLERGYDRVSGFVHRASEVAHLRTPDQVYAALGLDYAGSAFQRDADELHVLRWAAHRPSLYRIPYGGPHEAGMLAMQGWVIERPPFRGNGFAPSETGDVIAEFKVDSVRLPHGAQLWRIRADGSESLLALLDADGPQWRRVEA